MKSKIVTIGDELLIGQVIDSNSAWMASKLHEINVAVSEILTIGDELTDIISALKYCEDVDIVFITGGLGPTKDDKTKLALIDYLDDSLKFDQNTYDRILALFDRIGKEPTQAHKEQAFMPASAKLLVNEMGTAPAMLFENNGQILICMPGVPYEMKFIMENHVLEYLNQKVNGEQLYHRTIRTVGEGESRIAKKIEDILAEMPANLKIAYLPSIASVRLRLSIMGSEKDLLILQEFVDKIVRRIRPFVYGYDHETLEMAIGQMLKNLGASVATAESCTGGNIAKKLTSIPGSSVYFKGGVVAYSNDVKMKSLQVKEDTLQKFGAVSEQTVREMVKGILQAIDADYGIAVSGIAGPDGGTTLKPVGTIYIAVGDTTNIMTKKLQLSKNREINIEYSSVAALNMLRKFIIQKNIDTN